MVLINSLDKKAINTAILALDDDIKKVSNTSSSSSGSGITEGNTYNINISGNAATASKVKNALTLNVGGNATSYDGSSAKTVTIGSNAKLTVATTNTYTAASTTEYDGSTAKTATIYTPDQEVNKTSSPTFAGLSLTGTSLTVTSSLTGASVSRCWAKVYGNILRVHLDLAFTAQTISNGNIVCKLTGTLPTMTIVPIKMIVDIRASTTACSALLDILDNGNMLIYLHERTSLDNTLLVDGDCMLTLN